MKKVGTYLKQQRIRCHLSLKDVYEQSGITDSKLSRLERGEGKMLEPPDLKKLARLYEIAVVPLYIMAGYLDEQDLRDYQFLFRNAELLSEEEKQNIQTQINLFTKGRQETINDI